MNLVKKAKSAWIDLKIQKTFLFGRVKSIDGTTVIYDSVSTPYEIIHSIFFKEYIISPNDVIIDVGCGKGRVFNYLLYRGLKNKMIGYEINRELGGKTKNRLGRYKNVDIKCENIFTDFPVEGNVFYLFNPFSLSMMIDFKETIFKVKERNPVIIYYNSTCIEAFNDDRFRYEIINVPEYYYSLAIIRTL